MSLKSFSLGCLVAFLPWPAAAQVNIHIELGLPVAPPLVVIQPGIQVVEGFHEEVFFHQGWYWCRRHDGWYRARSPKARFGWVEERRVPRGLVQLPVGHYRNWHKEAHREAKRERREGRMERHEAHRAEPPRHPRDHGHGGEGKGHRKDD